MRNYFVKYLTGSFLLLASAGMTAQAQDDGIEGLETLDEQEQEIPSLPRIQGPITIIKPAALVFVGFDGNGDYLISRTEAASGIRTAFGRADKDSNNRVSLFELEDWRTAALGSIDALPGNLNFDTDYDNQVGRAEFETAMLTLFDRHDADKDGNLKHAELMQIVEVPRRKVQIVEVPRRKEPKKERQTDRECYEQIQRNRR